VNARDLVAAPGSTVTGFQFEQHAPHEYRLRRDFDWTLPYGAPSDPLPYGRGVVFLTNDATLLAFARDFD